jgi:hypothetical protein
LDPTIRTVLQNLIFAVLYLILFVILLPSLIRLLDQTAGKIAYGVLVAGGVGLALRLRQLSRRF